MSVAAAVLACGLHFPCDVPSQIDKPHKPAAHHAHKNSPPPKPPADVVVKVPPLPPVTFPHVEPEDFTPAPTIVQPAPPKKEAKKTMLQSIQDVYQWLSGLGWPAWAGIAAALYFGANKGLPWLKTKFGTLAGLLTADVKADIATLKAQLDALEASVKAPVAVAPAAPVA